MKLTKLEKANDGKHKFKATFQLDNEKTKIVKFGVQGSNSYIDGADDKTRNAYLKRHARDILDPDPTTKGNLSYYITWSGFDTPSRDTSRNVAEYKKLFNV
jgi:hypothetical protein